MSHSSNTEHQSPVAVCRFRLVEEKLVEFNQLAMANAEGNDDMLNRVMTKDNIGLCALLETKPQVFDNCECGRRGRYGEA